MIRVAYQNAVSYIENNHDCRSSGSKIRIRECIFCGSTCYDVSFNTETQIMTSFCCDRNTSLINVVKHEQSLKTTRQVIEHLSKFGDNKIVWVSNRTNLVSQTETSVKAQAIRERLFSLTKEKTLNREAIDLEHYSTDFSSSYGRRFLNYAKKRRVPEWFIESGRLGYFFRGKLRSRLCFLTVEDDEAVFAVGRAIEDNVEPKYLAVASEEIGNDFGSSDFVFNLDLVEENSDVVIHEGVLSALSGESGDVATFGKGISQVQIQKIADKNPSSVLFLIEQGVDVHRVVESALKMRSKGIFTMTAPLLRGDMNDDDTQFDEVLAGAQEVTRFSHIRSMISRNRI